MQQFNQRKLEKALVTAYMNATTKPERDDALKAILAFEKVTQSEQLAQKNREIELKERELEINRAAKAAELALKEEEFKAKTEQSAKDAEQKASYDAAQLELQRKVAELTARAERRAQRVNLLTAGITAAATVTAGVVTTKMVQKHKDRQLASILKYEETGTIASIGGKQTISGILK